MVGDPEPEPEEEEEARSIVLVWAATIAAEPGDITERVSPGWP